MARVAIVCATDQEAKHVVARLDGAVEGTLRRWRLVSGSIDGVETDVLVSRVGLVHASIATAALLSHAEASGRPYSGVISCGCAGSHDPHALPGDVVVSTRIVPLASQKLLADGTRRPAGVRIGMKTPDEPHYEADPALVATATAVVDALAIPAWPMVPGDDDANVRPPRAYMGAVGSTDTFCQHVPTLRTFRSVEGTACEEMEAAGVAGACEEYGVPFIAVKDVANNELRAADDAAFTWRPAPHVVAEYGLRSALVSLHLIRAHWGNVAPAGAAAAAAVSTASVAAAAAGATDIPKPVAGAGAGDVSAARLAEALERPSSASSGDGDLHDVAHVDADADDGDAAMCPSAIASASSMSCSEEPQSPPVIAKAAACADAAAAGFASPSALNLGRPAMIGRSRSWCCSMVASPYGAASGVAEGATDEAACGDGAAAAPASAFVSRFGIVARA